MPKVLFVDDEKDLVSTMQKIFSRRGMEFHPAYAGQEAVDRAKEIYPDVVILDIGLPDFDGFEVFRRLRQESTLKDVPVVFITGTYPEKQILGLKNGADDFILKPFDVDELLSRIQAVLRGYGHEE